MRRKAVLATLATLVLALAGTIIAQASPHKSWVSDTLSRAVLRSGLKEAAGAVPLVQRIVDARWARGDGSAPAAPATVETDKRAYLPGSEVIATGSGWSSGAVVTLTYTEIGTTEQNGGLNAPVTVSASTDGSGSFSSAGNPNATYKTSTNHNATVTVQLTATGLDASGNPASVSSATFTNGVTVTTDYNKYALGQPMTISGAGFTADVTVTVLLPNHTTDTLPASVTDGAFSVVYAPPPVPGRYKISATDGVYAAETAATEADAIAVDFRQCANNDPSNTGVNLGQCHWINSILQSSNARIFEGMSTLQRLILTDVPASTNSGNYRIQFHTDALKAASHAYDFITTWETTIDATNELAPAPLTQPVPLYPDTPPASLKLRTPEANALACGEGIAAPQKPFCLALRNAANPNVTYADLDPAQVDNFDPVIGDTVGDKLAAYQGRYGVPLYGAGNEKHAVKFYSNAAIDAAVFTLLGYDAQGNANYELRWHSAGIPTQVLIEFAAHVAVGQDTIGYGVGYGLGRGAANISGGPYHVSIDLADFGCNAGTACGGSNGHDDDASLGSQDNQLKGADILTPPQPPTITSQASSNGTIAPGTSVTDTVTVSGSVGTPTGTVTFFLCGPGADPALGCPTGGTNIGTITLSGGQAVSAPVAPTDPGFYCFRAEYSGAPPTYLPGSHTNNTTECFTIGTASTTLTLVSQLPSPVAVGGTVTVIVRETNTGTLPLSNVSVTGGGKCAASGFTGGATTLAPGASTLFTCTFTATAGANAWTADGHGTDANGNQVSATGEHAEGSVPGLTSSTTLVLASQTPAGANQPVGTVITIVVTETNTGTTNLSAVNVTGGGKCAASGFTGGAATLAPGASTNFTCTFTVTAGANAWTADGHGTDQFGTPVPSTGEHAEGSVQGLTSSTTLVLASQTPAGANQPVGTVITIVVTETNTGTTNLSAVNVTGGGKCAASGFTGGAATLAPGASTNFTCTFTVTAGANAWTADGHGTDQFGTPVPSTGEHAEGSVQGLTSSTTLVLASQTPAGANQPVGTVITIVVTETNTGTTNLSAVNVTGGGKCAASGFTGGAATLAPGASTNFTCTFTVTAGANAWTADGHGTDQFGTPVPSTGEHAEGSVQGLTSSTTLVLASQTPAGANQPVGTVITIVVTETNTGTTNLSAVNVTGGGKCAASGFTGGAATLAPGASTNFTCTFTVTAGANAWTADGHGTDQFGTPVPSTGEHAEGSVQGLTTSTTLTLVSQLPSPVEVPGTVTVIVRETNTGTTSLTNVNVTGGGKCASFTPASTTLAPGASALFTCTFASSAGANDWFADGHGTDQFGNPAPSAGEHASGSVRGVAPATVLTLKSVSPGLNVPIGTLITIVVTETNTGNGTLTNVNVTGGGKCASFTPASTTLAQGASADFTCTFVATLGANPWSADGHGTDELGNPAPATNEHQAGTVVGFDTHVQLTKLVNGGTPSASDPAFQFQLWTGLSAITPGTLLETKTTTPGVNNVLNFATSLVPGAKYQICELVVNGYTPDFSGTGFGSFNPGGNNVGYICFEFTANLTSDTLLVTVNNIHQVGLALTIGYWKNHASCSSSNGNQEPVTDQVLQLFEPAGFTIGILTLHDTNPDPDIASDCLAIVNLLNKTAITGGKKLASDPLFNMAAQLVAYYLNVQNGASSCSAVANAAQALLAAHLFDGLTHTALTKDQAAYASALNGLLDTYNNNNGCGVPPTPPNPL